jgi:hypothetical protein
MENYKVVLREDVGPGDHIEFEQVGANLNVFKISENGERRSVQFALEKDAEQGEANDEEDAEDGVSNEGQSEEESCGVIHCDQSDDSGDLFSSESDENENPRAVHCSKSFTKDGGSLCKSVGKTDADLGKKRLPLVSSYSLKS